MLDLVFHIKYGILDSSLKLGHQLVVESAHHLWVNFPSDHQVITPKGDFSVL